MNGISARASENRNNLFCLGIHILNFLDFYIFCIQNKRPEACESGMEEFIQMSASTSILTSLFVFLGSLLIGWFVRRSLFLYLKKWSERTETRIDDLILVSVRGPSALWVLLFSIHLALRTSHLGPILIEYGSLTHCRIYQFWSVCPWLIAFPCRHTGFNSINYSDFRTLGR